MTSDPNNNRERGIDPNAGLLFGLLAYALVNFVVILLLLAHLFSDTISILAFFTYVAPVSACGIVFFVHMCLQRGFHSLALAGFVLSMILAAFLNFQCFSQAVAAV